MSGRVAERRARATLLAVALLATLALAAAGCSAGQDSRAAEAFRAYFASTGSHALKGLTVTKVSAKTHDGVRTLYVNLTTDEGAPAYASLNSLVLGGASDEGWVADLNKTGLGIAYVEVRVVYASHTIPDELNVIDVGRQSVGTTGGPAWPDIGPTPATTEAPRPSAQ